MKKALAAIFGSLGLLVGLACLASAAALFVFNAATDEDGFFAADEHRFQRDTFAIVSEDIDVASGARWLESWIDSDDFVDIRVEGSTNSGKPIFVGIGPDGDVRDYLAGVAYDEVTEVDLWGAFSVDYRRVAGTGAAAEPPGERAFWAASVEGSGVQTLEWAVERGIWSVVVMNADGSVGVDVDLELAARVPLVLTVAWVLAVFGLFSVAGGGYLFHRGVRREPALEEEEAAEAPSAEPVEAPVPAMSKGLRERKGFAMTKREGDQGSRFFEWVNRRFVLVTAFVLVVAFVLGGISAAIGSDEEPEFDPSGEIYDTADRVDDVFGVEGGIQQAVFLVEHPDDGDVLSRDALLEWKTNSAALRSASYDFRGDPVNSPLVATFDAGLGVEVDGIYSLADAVDAALPGGLEGATDADVKVALDGLLADDAPTASLRTTISRLATATPGKVAGQDIEVWTSPAFQSFVLYDIDAIDVTTTSTVQDDIDADRWLEAQRWLREVQSALRGDQANFSAIGLGIDIDLEFEEQATEAMPFILLAVVIILIVVGALLRSYWAAAYMGIGLAVTTMIYKGLFALVGLKGGLLLGFIVPISIISFGVDFFIHATGRSREAQVMGHPRERAYPLGLSAVFLALSLAALSSAAAFVSNAVSGIQMVVQFGVGAAIALLAAFAVLGLLLPKLLLVTEDALGPGPEPHGLQIFTRLGFILMSLVAGVVVAFAVVFPLVGGAAALVFALLFLYLPFRLTRRRNVRAAAAGQPVVDEVRGVGHGLRAAGYVVHFLARWRVVTIPVVVALALAGVWGASQVRSDFSFTDFLASDSDAVRGVERQEFHFGSLGVGTGYIYIEGDLTEPATLEAMDAALTAVTTSGVEFSRDFDGEVEAVDNAVTLAQFAATTSGAGQSVLEATGVAITDDDGNGLPDTAEQVAAAYEAASTVGLADDAGQIVFPPDRVQQILYRDGDTQATRIEVVIGTFTDGDIIGAARTALDEAAADLATATAGARIDAISVSGDPITNRNTLDSFTRSMLLSLPLAVLLTFLIVGLILRSIKYSAVSVTPILLVVAWVYGFMYLVDYTINPVTATIAAISIGVGIDFATHFTVRFREELVGEPSRFPALRRAGEGTGGALTLSAITSITGFMVLGLAPMPIFAVYGILTAVMIAFAVLVSLLVLPSLLLLVTPSLKGEEREELEWELTHGEWSYQPHERETAVRDR